MSRVYREPAEVHAREDGRPARFVWRGRLYAVRVVLEHWVVNRDWWREPGPSRPEPSRPEPSRPEQEFWRVEASPGQGIPAGVYELRHEIASDAWTLRRVMD